jgi:hypothetical protein
VKLSWGRKPAERRAARELEHHIRIEALLRQWTPEQVQAEVKRETGYRQQELPAAHITPQVRRDLRTQPTPEGRAFWAVTAPSRHEIADSQYRLRRPEQARPWEPHGWGQRRLNVWEREGRQPTAADIWRETHAPGPGRGHLAGDPYDEHLNGGLSREARWHERQDFRVHDCGKIIATGGKADPHEPHDCREMPGYIEAMHEDAIAEHTRRYGVPPEPHRGRRPEPAAPAQPGTQRQKAAATTPEPPPARPAADLGQSLQREMAAGTSAALTPAHQPDSGFGQSLRREIARGADSNGHAGFSATALDSSAGPDRRPDREAE